jgi:hypothetical protein
MLGLRLRQVLAGGGLAALLLWSLAGVSFAGSANTCDLTVKPAAGPPGTEFVFRGSGYSPTELQLTRQGSPTRVVPLSLDGADPFHFSVVAGDGDVGKWKAVAMDAAAGCDGMAVIRVTLPGTFTIDDALAVDRTPVLAAFAGLAGVFVLTTGFLVRRGRRQI